MQLTNCIANELFTEQVQISNLGRGYMGVFQLNYFRSFLVVLYRDTED
jgi:hypothetical protein